MHRSALFLSMNRAPLRCALSMNRAPLRCALSILMLAGCQDYLDGQAGEPAGPLQVTRLTLLDATSRPSLIFTDTSVPLCTPQTEALPSCAQDPRRDQYSPARSPPTPDSGGEMRVVFNKLPTLLGGAPLERVGAGASGAPTYTLAGDVARLLCLAAPCGVPPIAVSLAPTGSSFSYDPTEIPYGPALLLTTASDDPLAALEPATGYQVALAPALSGRDGAAVNLDAAAQQRLSFTTEPFQILQAGIGDPENDPYLSDAGQADGSAARPLAIYGLAPDGVVTLGLNAPLDAAALGPGLATATLGSGAAVPVGVGIDQIVLGADGSPACDPGAARQLYLFADTPDGKWGGQAVSLQLRGDRVRDLSQAPGHPALGGRHALAPGTIYLNARIAPAGASYTGLHRADISQRAQCPK